MDHAMLKSIYRVYENNLPVDIGSSISILHTLFIAKLKFKFGIGLFFSSIFLKFAQKNVNFILDWKIHCWFGTKCIISIHKKWEIKKTTWRSNRQIVNSTNKKKPNEDLKVEEEKKILKTNKNEVDGKIGRRKNMAKRRKRPLLIIIINEINRNEQKQSKKKKKRKEKKKS